MKNAIVFSCIYYVWTITGALGDNCTSSYDCRQMMPLSQCLNNTCSCKTERGTYYCKSEYFRGYSCSNDFACSSIMQYSRCFNGECACTADGRYSDYSCKSVYENTGYSPHIVDVFWSNVAVYVGSNQTLTCEYNGGYIVQLSWNGCFNGVQYFPNKYVNDQHLSLDFVATGTDQECIFTSTLGSIEKTVSVLVKLTRKVIGSRCGESADCSGTCTCDRYVNNSVCTNMECTCDEGYKTAVVQKQTQCIKRILGDWCDSNYTCSLVIPNSECLNGACACLTGRLQSGKDRCKPGVLADWCDSDYACSLVIPNSQCLDGACACRSDSLQSGNDKCNPGLLGDRCDYNYTCSLVIPQSQCLNGACACLTGRLQSGKHRCNPGVLGDWCDSDYACSLAIPNSQCLDGACACRSDSLQSGNDKCNPGVLGDWCDSNYACSLVIPNSQCLNGACACLKDRLQSGKDRCKPGVLGDWCDSNYACSLVIPNSQCLNVTCACLKDRLQSGKDRCKPGYLGDACESSEDCADTNTTSVCSDAGTCVCPRLYVQQDSSSQCTPTTNDTEYSPLIVGFEPGASFPVDAHTKQTLTCTYGGPAKVKLSWNGCFNGAEYFPESYREQALSLDWTAAGSDQDCICTSVVGTVVKSVAVHVKIRSDTVIKVNIIVGIVAGVLGILSTVAGFVCYKRKCIHCC